MHKLEDKKEKLMLGVAGILLLAYDTFIFTSTQGYWFMLQLLLLVIIHRTLVDKKPLNQEERLGIVIAYLFAAGVVQAVVDIVRSLFSI